MKKRPTLSNIKIIEIPLRVVAPLSSIWKRYERTIELLIAAVLAALYVFLWTRACGNRCGELGDCGLSLLVAKNCQGRLWRNRSSGRIRGDLGCIYQRRGGFSAGFSGGFDAYQWTVILLQTAAAIYLTIRGLDNLAQWRSDKG